MALGGFFRNSSKKTISSFEESVKRMQQFQQEEELRRIREENIKKQHYKKMMEDELMAAESERINLLYGSSLKPGKMNTVTTVKNSSITMPVGMSGSTISSTGGGGSFINGSGAIGGWDVSTTYHYKILGAKYFSGGLGTIGFVAIDSNKGQWKVYCGSCRFNSPDADEQAIAAQGAPIHDWLIATAMFPELDPQLFIGN